MTGGGPGRDRLGTALTWLVLCAMLVLRSTWKEVPGGGEIHYVSMVRRAVEPRWVEGDFALARYPASYHHTYLAAGRAVSRVTSVVMFAQSYRAAVTAATALGFLALCVALGLSRLDAVVAFGLFCALTAVPAFLLAGYGVFPPTAQPDPLAWGIALLGYAAAIRGRWLAAGVLLGAATSTHLLVGLQLSPPVLLAAALALRRGPSGRKRLAAVFAAWAVCAAISVVPQALGMRADPFPPAASRAYFYRVRHHLDFALFPVPLAVAVATLAAGLELRRRGAPAGPRPDDRCLALAFGFIGAYWAAAVLLRLGHAYGPLKAYPYRTWPLVLIGTILYGVRLARSSPRYRDLSARLGRLGGRPPVRIALAAVSAGALAMSCVTHLGLRELAAAAASRSLPRGSRDTPLYAWIRANTPADSAFVTPPEFWWSDFTWRTDRGMSFHGQVFPVTSEGVVEWLRRKTLLEALYTDDLPPPAFGEALLRVAADVAPDYIICPRNAVAADWLAENPALRDAGFADGYYLVLKRVAGRRPSGAGPALTECESAGPPRGGRGPGLSNHERP